ncbi:hypothetical protein K469DRAFT_808105 [Zopfia rhizophila CBS 207.26]|uniref:Phosphatidylglycerol/phosphatidylinositol transfer protein n=1 Tax=Zopfia rhizophila CBS 207.26 TaxID=1314779 RepID=A0A6A6EK15_9PEZI|nr:hypothetical protein K469DRAFT_808105 [Zopfia rhizophila CBS 207.26]
MSSSLLLIFALGISAVSAANNVIFRNYCPYDLYYWAVYPKTPAPRDQDYEIVPAYSVQYHAMANPDAGGISLKIRDKPHYEVAPAGILQLEYNLEPYLIWYDFSAIDCRMDHSKDSYHCPFLSRGVHVTTTGPSECQSMFCSLRDCDPRRAWNHISLSFLTPLRPELVSSAILRGSRPRARILRLLLLAKAEAKDAEPDCELKLGSEQKTDYDLVISTLIETPFGLSWELIQRLLHGESYGELRERGDSTVRSFWR